MLTVRQNPGRQALTEPYLAVMDSVPATLRIGIHIRMGDSAVANAKKKGDKRYGPGCVWVLSTVRAQGSRLA